MDAYADVSKSDYAVRLQELVLGIWRDVLGIAEIGLDNHFLTIGGDWLGATRFIARARQALGCSLDYAEVFEHRTARRLAGLLMERVTVPPVV